MLNKSSLSDSRIPPVNIPEALHDLHHLNPSRPSMSLQHFKLEHRNLRNTRSQNLSKVEFSKFNFHLLKAEVSSFFQMHLHRQFNLLI